MKKILIGGGIAVIAAFTLITAPTFAAKSTDTCKYIQDGTLKYAAGHYLENTPLTLGFDVFGYNYQAHIFNGSYANAYLGRPGSKLLPYNGDDESYLEANPNVTDDPFGVWPFRNVQLQMKWNDAWLANKDCNGGEGGVSDGVLDRPNPVKGSGAWLTNHATGTYTSSTKSHWDVTGTWLLDFAGGTDNREFVDLAQDGSGNVTGAFWWLNGAVWEYGGTLVGTVSGNTLHLDYDRAPILYTGVFDGTIGDDVITAGTFRDSHGNNLTWTAAGTSVEVYDTCTVSDFVKIVAVPSTAHLGSTELDDYGEGMWYTDNTEATAIGPALWGDFAVIQEIASDPCEEYGVIDYMSPLRKGLGHW